MDHKRLVLSVNSEDIPQIRQGLETPVRNSLKSLLRALRERISEEDLTIFTPDTLVSTDEAYVFKNGILVDSDVSTDTFLLWSVNSNDERFGMRYLAEQFQAYRNFAHRVGRYTNPLDSKKLLDKKNLESFDVPTPIIYKVSNWDEISGVIKTEKKSDPETQNGRRG